MISKIGILESSHFTSHKVVIFFSLLFTDLFFLFFLFVFFPETNLQTYCYADNDLTVDHLDSQFLKYNQRRNEKLSKHAQQSKV